MMLLAETIEAKFEFPEKLRGLDGWLEMTQALFTNYPLLGVLITLMLVDIILGTMAAYLKGKISSSSSQYGMMKKFVTLLVIVVARVMELIIPQAPLMNIGCLGFIAAQLKSIVENCGKLGVPLPYYLTRGFEQFRLEQEQKSKPPTVVEVNMEKHEDVPPGMRPSKFKKPSDVVLNVKDSGEIEIVDEKSHSNIVIPHGLKGEPGEQGPKGDKGEKGDKGDKYPPSKGA